MLHRAHQICSSFTLLHEELNQISLLLEKMATLKLFKQAH